MYRRHIAERIIKALADTPVVLLHGARQTGKTTLARMLQNEGYFDHYLTLDSAGVRSLAQADPEGFLSGYSGRVILDEVQRVPDLLIAIKRRVDENRLPGQYLLTGSANVFTVPRVAETLTGRVAVFTLWSLSQGELSGVREDFIGRAFQEPFQLPSVSPILRAEMIQRIVTGGYPEAVHRTDEQRRQEWFESYITTVLYREIRELSNVEGLLELPRLLALIALRTTSTLNHTDLAQQIGMSRRTLDRYLSLLHSAYLVVRLPAWFRNIEKRLIKSPKLYLTDTGLMSYLLGMSEARLQQDPEWLGRFLEAFVLMEIWKQIGWSEIRVTPFHFRTPEGREVDIVLEDRQGRVVGIEVKASGSVSSDDFKGLQTLATYAPSTFLRGFVLYLGTEAIPFGKNFYALPVSALWS